MRLVGALVGLPGLAGRGRTKLQRRGLSHGYSRKQKHLGRENMKKLFVCLLLWWPSFGAPAMMDESHLCPDASAELLLQRLKQHNQKVDSCHFENKRVASTYSSVRRRPRAL
jgi:hypothetical protein